MKDFLSVFLVLMVFLAGCAGSAGGPNQDKADADFTDIDVDVTDTTGVILGLVVDDRIVPIAEADVKITIPGGAPVTVKTDDKGRFVFQGLAPGTYFLQVSHPLHAPTQTAADVEAGVKDPPLVRVQLERLFSEDPYSAQIVKEGFFECTMAGPGPWYGSAMCVDYLLGPVADEYPPSHNLTQQKREWHADVGPGWQTIVFDMTWEPTAQGTSAQMGLVVSTYKPTRNTAHSFAHVQSGDPLWIRLDTGVEHPTAANADPRIIPAEGMENISYFAGVRGFPAAVALNQDFKVFLHIFYYGLLEKEDWSFVNGDKPPF